MSYSQYSIEYTCLDYVKNITINILLCCVEDNFNRSY